MADDDLLIGSGSYTSRLSPIDQYRLRAVVKATHLKSYPKEMITDYEADKLIDALGPKVGQDLIERAMRHSFIE